MYDLGKVVFDPGHFHGANVDPKYPDYSEGTEMLKLGKMLQERLGVPLTRTDGKDIDFSERVRRAKAVGADTLISLHSNYPNTGVLVIYSIHRPQDKPIAEWIGKAIANALGIKFREARTRKSEKGNYDYYGMIRQPYNAGIRPFIVEHGAHSELAIDTQKKFEKIVEVYVSILEGGSVLLKRGSRGNDVKTLQTNLTKLGFPCGSIDGIFGEKTEKAVREFQKKHGLSIDGIAGPKTLGKIAELLKPKSETEELKDKIKALEKHIKDLTEQKNTAVISRQNALERLDKAKAIAKGIAQKANEISQI
jgi:hypothetical protein